MVLTCAVYGCRISGRHDNSRRFFRFPKNEVRCKQWLQASQRDDLRNRTPETLNKNFFICDLHFQDSDRFTKKLKTNAVPTLNLPQFDNANPTKATQTVDFKPLGEEMSTQTGIMVLNTGTQTTQNLCNKMPFKRKLLNDLQRQRKRLKILEQEKNSYIPPVLKKLVDLQNKLKGEGNGNRYDKDFKLFALNMFFADLHTYRVLSKILTLPSERTLRRMNVLMGTKLNPKVLTSLESKLKNLQDNDKYCVICADETSLKRHLHYQINWDKIIGFHEIDGVQTTEPALKAFVLMARGIYSSWKQPLAYCFLAHNKNYTDLDVWLDDVISKIMLIGYRVVAFVSKQSPIFLNIIKVRNVTVEEPYFYINEKKIYYIFDVPHLFKSVRNSLLRYNFEVLDISGTQLIIKWEDIENLYQEDCKNTYRLAPQLTQSHIRPSSYEKMELKYVTQVFSGAVAAAFNCMIELGRLQRTALGTVTFIELMDKAYDVLNSNVMHDDLNKYKIAFAALPYQMDVLNWLDSFLAHVTVYSNDGKNVTASIKCLKGLKLTLNSIKSLSQDLVSYGLNFLFTQRLNQDPLGTLLDEIKRNCREPTPIQFSRGFGKLFTANILKRSQNSKSSYILEQLLSADVDIISKAVSKLPEIEDFSHEETIQSLSVGTLDYRFDLPETNVLVYISGYLMTKCFDIHKCDAIKQYMAKYCKYVDEDTTVIDPPKRFITCVKAMDDTFEQFFQNKKIKDPVGNEIFKQLSNISFDDCCPCFPNDYLKKIYIRLRIFNVMQSNNKLFRDKSQKQKYFSVSEIQ